MSEYTPTGEESRECYASSGDGLDFKRRFNERLVEHDRMIAEVERAAAEKALTAAADEEERVSQQYALTADGMRDRKEWADSNRYANYAAGHAATAHALRARAAAHRRNEGENDA
ncbi:hypothetical protein EDF60_1669 [Leucobacter luti]|uniref:hypothetical protein n=1 Tax=Leucobacter luti TaxID=340320 RepID=UPI001049F602|nr:hypothetical protein [Leucobacter luti]MCW2287018.1 hypothetical protein [Leucobacter luti]TCK41243.1 hypothetical protein EDF60_1669 [Leucobacter luti]